MASVSSLDISKEHEEVHDNKDSPGSDNTCRKCRRARRRMNVKKFCKRDYVVVVHVLSRESDTDNWVKFTVNVMSIYKRKQMHIRRGASYLWVSRNDLSCKCPKIRVGRRYLVVGKTARHPNQSGYMINRRSIVLRWNDEWQQRIRKYVKYEKRGKC